MLMWITMQRIPWFIYNLSKMIFICHWRLDATFIWRSSRWSYHGEHPVWQVLGYSIQFNINNMISVPSSKQWISSWHPVLVHFIKWYETGPKNHIYWEMHALHFFVRHISIYHKSKIHKYYIFPVIHRHVNKRLVCHSVFFLRCSVLLWMTTIKF